MVPIGIGIMYLARLSGTAKNGPGLQNCGRVSCSWNSAIIWCNKVEMVRSKDMPIMRMVAMLSFAKIGAKGLVP
ncbi:hypothetical protein QBC36DRAFT_293965 [Triangularia setosa]|uniref:Uncharacterized protein n=1 Tax=Triangularia setosa TaxID=2587417 RepID=A0AAN6W217_9PEZI|nr:hypothetical protein QBC36DRAFT_293965 [Podospora setosa]